MAYSIDTDRLAGTASTLHGSARTFRDAGTAFAWASGLLTRSVADDSPALSAALARFSQAHGASLEATGTALEALSGRLTWGSQSAHKVEADNATQLGGIGASAPLDSYGVRW